MSSVREPSREISENMRELEGAMSVAALRRSSSHHTPTRTLHLSEQEHSSSYSPSRVLLVVSDRPRSNQRTRTPMRHESPAHPDELRAVSPEPTAATVRRRSNVSPLNSVVASGRITIRPLAGAAVGTLSTTMVSFDWVDCPWDLDFHTCKLDFILLLILCMFALGFWLFQWFSWLYSKGAVQQHDSQIAQARSIASQDSSLEQWSFWSTLIRNGKEWLRHRRWSFNSSERRRTFVSRSLWSERSHV